MRTEQRKVFRALTADTVEKRFVASDEPTPEGWFDSPSEALESQPEDAPKRRGRKPKEQ